MNDDDKPPTYAPRAGRSVLWNRMMESIRRVPPDSPLTGELLFSNCTTSIPFKFEFHDGDVRHTLLWGGTREGMSEAGKPVKAALMPDGNIMLISQGAVERGSMPPGIERMLTDEEFALLCLERTRHGMTVLSDAMIEECHRQGRKPDVVVFDVGPSISHWKESK
jgi:hypothetical protein